MRTLLVAIAGVALAFGFLAVNSWLVQVLHDSCRLWHEPPAWSFLCPPSTRHGVK
jgi:hypothetical protein